MSARRSIIPIFIPHLGCPNRCVFCDQHAIATACAPTPDEVAHTIEAAQSTAGADAQVAFYGGSFTAIPRELMIDYLDVARGHEIRVSTHPAAVDSEVLNEMWRRGVRTVELGAQSMDDNVLVRAQRGHTAADTGRAARLVKEGGFSLVLQMMVGLPGDSSPMYTAQKLLELKPDAVRIYPVVVVRGTELERMWRGGEYEPLTPQTAAELSAEPFELFETAGVPVIRMGLNPTEELSGQVVAGAYHPALGEMVRSEIMLKNARTELKATQMVDITLTVSKGKASQMAGQHRSNINKLKTEFHLNSITINESSELNGYTVELKES